MEGKRKRLATKKLRYQEMFANDVMTMAELREKTAQIAKEMAALDERATQFDAVQMNVEKKAEWYRGEIERFLRLETAANPDLRRLIDHISVNREGSVRIIMKKLGDGDARQNLPSLWRQ